MLRLMSNNVWNRDKNAPAWEERGEDCSAPARAPLFVRIYEETRPDVIGMQEMTNLMTRELISGLAAKGLNYAVLWGNFTPIFYRPEKLELLDTAYLPYPEEVPGFDGCFNDVKSKSALFAVFREKESGKCFLFVTTHLWWKSSNPAWNSFQAGSDEARAYQVGLLLDRAREMQEKYRCPAVVVGDLNTKLASPAVQTLLNGGFRYAADAATDYATAEHGYHKCDTNGYAPYTPRPITEAIDHIFVSAAPALTVRRFDRPTPAYYAPASDHFPAFADVEL